MGFKERLEKNILKMEKRISKEEFRLEKLTEKYKAKHITKAKYNIEKSKIEERIKNIKHRINALKGLAVKELHERKEKENK